jgi:hypothetical protein
LPLVGQDGPGKSANLESEKSLYVVKQAAINALSVHGFEITDDNATYVEGHRPRDWKPFRCSPGGEGAGIWLEQTNPSLTRAWIKSEKSFIGMACQKNWTLPILTEMRKILENRR